MSFRNRTDSFNLAVFYPPSDFLRELCCSIVDNKICKPIDLIRHAEIKNNDPLEYSPQAFRRFLSGKTEQINADASQSIFKACLKFIDKKILSEIAQRHKVNIENFLNIDVEGTDEFTVKIALTDDERALLESGFIGMEDIRAAAQAAVRNVFQGSLRTMLEKYGDPSP